MRITAGLVALSLVMNLIECASIPALADWPQFRGPHGDNHATMKNPPTHWSESNGLRWKVAIPGKGWSSPVIADGQVWLTTAITTQPNEEDLIRKALRNDFAEDKTIVGSVESHAVCIDLQSGKMLHDVALGVQKQADPIHSLNSYASPTPAISGKRIVCHFGNNGTWCLDTDSGKVLWKAEYVVDHSVGPGSSPVIVDGVVLLVCDGINEQFVAGVDLESGKELWKTPRPSMRPKNVEQHKAYCTPLIVESNGIKQAIIPTAQWIVSYDPRTGKEFWRADHGEGFSTSPSPIFESNLVVFSTGFMRPVLVGMNLDGVGDVTSTKVKWQATKGAPTVSSPVGYDGRIYSLTDSGIVTCIDAHTGEELGKRRIGGKFSASPLLLGNRLYLCGQDGKVTILAANTEMEVLAVNEMGEQLMASPAVEEESLIVRGASHLFNVSTE